MAWCRRNPLRLRLLGLAAALSAATAQAAPVLIEDTLAQCLAACTVGHGAQGRAAPDGYHPRIAGKPEGYLFNQLQNFRDGRRGCGAMVSLVGPLPDAYLREIARHFAALYLPYPTPVATSELPAGTVYVGNLTPDADTGIGRWIAGHFWRALQHGRGFDGQRLVPVFPYTKTTRITRADSDALFAWARTVPAVQQPNRDHALRWPYGSQPALAVWRALFFRPGPWQDDVAQSA